jgi:hypothetical protein
MAVFAGIRTKAKLQVQKPHVAKILQVYTVLKPKSWGWASVYRRVRFELFKLFRSGTTVHQFPTDLAAFFRKLDGCQNFPNYVIPQRERAATKRKNIATVLHGRVQNYS